MLLIIFYNIIYNIFYIIYFKPELVNIITILKQL